MHGAGRGSRRRGRHRVGRDDHLVTGADIQRAAVDARKAKATEALAGAGTDKERQAAEADVRVADAMLDAIERKTKH